MLGKTIRICLLLVIGLGLTACDSGKSGGSKTAKTTAGKPAGNKDERVLRIGWVKAMANAPILVAKEKGYFKELGLNVQIKFFTSGPRIRSGLMSGDLDMAYIGAPPVYHWYSRGLKSKILAKVNYGQASVIVHKDSGITSINGMKGKEFAGVKKGSGMDVLLRGYVLTEAGKMDPRKDLNITPMKPGSMGAAVENKRVSGAFSWEPFTSQYLARGNVKIIMDMNKEVPNYPWYVIMAMPDAMKTKRDMIVKVLKAHKKAVDFLNSSPTAGNDIIAKHFHLTTVKDTAGKETSPEQILAEARKRLGWEYRLNKKDKDFIQRLMNYSHSLGYIKKKLTVSELLDNSFMDEALK